MTKSRLHVHQCVDCGTPVDCDGTLEQNYDGWPEVVCDWVDGYLQTPLCESCDDARQQAIRDEARVENDR